MSESNREKLERLEALERWCRALRQADIAGLLRDSQDRRVSLVAERWSAVAQHIDGPGRSETATGNEREDRLITDVENAVRRYWTGQE